MNSQIHTFAVAPCSSEQDLFHGGKVCTGSLRRAHVVLVYEIPVCRYFL